MRATASASSVTSAGPQGAKIDQGGSLTWKPTEDQGGEQSIAINAVLSGETVTQTVHVTAQTVFGSNIQPAGLLGLQSGAVVEMSGFANSVGELVATRIEAKGQSNVSRVAGSVRTLNQIQHTFYVNSLKIDYGNAQVDAVVTDGAPVTAQGVEFAADGALIANQVRASGAAHGQPGSIGRIQGLITSYSSGAYFEVNGQPVSVGAQTKLSLPVPIGVDVEVNVAGTFDTNGVLVADSVQSSK